MTATLPEQRTTVPRDPNPAPPFGSRETLLRGPKPRHVDVVVQGIDGPARYRLRELKQGELEEINAASFDQEQVDGKNVFHLTKTGNKARAVAFSLVNEDMTPYFGEPLKEFGLLNKALSAAQMDVLYTAYLKLNAIGEEAQGELGKTSGTTGGSTNSS